MSDNTPLDHHSRALDFALGRLSAEEETAFMAELRSTPALQEEFQTIMESVSLVAEGYASAMPSPRKALRDRVLDYATGHEASSDDRASTHALHIVRAGDSDWQESGLPGITMKPLYADAARQTVLVRIAAGVHYPKHRHVGTEECLVLEGDLNMNDIRLKKGDFIVNPDGAEHLDTWSEEGCLLLLTGSLNDDFTI
jgi:anti-sigma factor ChrR (cupin superfamily)